MDIEAVLLTGGASRRMGEDKSRLLVDGEPMAVRIARLLAGRGIRVTVSGVEALEGRAFLPDREQHGGPLLALSRFEPSSELVFIVSCDVPGFDPAVVEILADHLGDSDAAVPELEGRLQPLCALYRSSALKVAEKLVHGGERRVMTWLERLRVVVVSDIDPVWVSNVNTPADLKRWAFGEKSS
ncbi:MAG: molybdenum cofactor guanylyltransferase [Fimbriimonadales bacterium]